METQLKVLAFIQETFEKTLDGYTNEQINQIPEGFKNNLIWNYAHIISALQMLCYVRAGIKPVLDQGFIDRYKIGTKPEGTVSAEEYQQYKAFAKLGVEKLGEDYAAHKFAGFQGFKTMSGIELTNIELAIEYAIMHAGLHSGYILALKKFIK
ncbi:DinB family protein [Ferruginibacter lapsinanis]|uniref:DinB family protein n=1 Tax=Ferruginibacter lapsinanis TaxID=563172 RepID=UPI001E637896|nr:DinB family protein [Ferruginibacter lapsinanis]UEG49153.1 DinB family protein [Ferruginibacter lapsinanis]